MRENVNIYYKYYGTILLSPGNFAKMHLRSHKKY